MPGEPVLKRVAILLGVAAGPALLVVTWIGLLAGFLAGGLSSVVVWLLGQLLLPVVGILGLAHAIPTFFLHKASRPVTAASGVLSLVSLAPIAMVLGLWMPTYPASIDAMQPHATVRLPLDGPVIVGWGGDSVDVNYHAAHPDQRWAYDLLVEPAGHGSASLDDYGCYGLPVLAPADGRIVITHDGEPDQAGGAFTPNYTAPAGNYVGLRLAETGTHLVLAHLMPGSLAVSVGDEVEEGDLVGRCGNSGNTSEPHVHIHHVRQEPEFIGFGEGLPLFFRDHDGPPMPEGGLRVDDDEVVFEGARVQHRGRR